MTFHPAPAPSDAEVAAALTTIRHRVQRLLVRHGVEPADDDLHANVWVSGNDRARLERLCRYILRPPFAQERLPCKS